MAYFTHTKAVGVKEQVLESYSLDLMGFRTTTIESFQKHLDIQSASRLKMRPQLGWVIKKKQNRPCISFWHCITNYHNLAALKKKPYLSTSTNQKSRHSLAGSSARLLPWFHPRVRFSSGVMTGGKSISKLLQVVNQNSFLCGCNTEVPGSYWLLTGGLS